ncbi:MAG: TetR/AcrR family transcriptional regulator [Nakamurella sp.]
MPRRVDRDERRAELAAALVDIAATRGLRAVTMREVAAQAGVSLRQVQYYFTSKDELLDATWKFLADRLTARVIARAAAVGKGLPPRIVLSVTMSAILPMDDQTRHDALASAAFYATALTQPGFADSAMQYPNALQNFLASEVRKGQAAGQIASTRDPAAEGALLLALTNGLTSSVLAGQRDAHQAAAILEYHLDQLFGAQASTPS